MNIQNVNFITAPKSGISFGKKSSSPVKSTGLQSDVFTLSSPKKKKPGLLTTIAVSLGLMSALTGCGNSKTQDVNVSPSVKSTSYSSSYGSDYTSLNKPAIDFGIGLLNADNNIDFDYVKNDINDFFKENSISGIEIKDISASSEIPHTLMGAFVPKYDGLNYNGGTLYIGKPSGFSDKNQKIKYAEQVAHELTHVLQFSKDDTLEGMKGIVTDASEAKTVFNAINDFKQTQPVNYIRNAALSDYVYNSMSSSEYRDVIDNINSYGLALYDKEISISSSKVRNSVTNTLTDDSSKSFEDTVNSVTDLYLNNFAKKYGISSSDAPKMKKALLANIIFNYKAEAEAYRTSTAVEEAAFGIKGDSLSDFVPETYDEIIPVLEKKLQNDFGS